MKAMYDDILKEYIDEKGNIIQGHPVTDRASYGQYFEVKEIIGGTEKDENS